MVALGGELAILRNELALIKVDRRASLPQSQLSPPKSPNQGAERTDSLRDIFVITCMVILAIIVGGAILGLLAPILAYIVVIPMGFTARLLGFPGF